MPEVQSVATVMHYALSDQVSRSRMGLPLVIPPSSRPEIQDLMMAALSPDIRARSGSGITPPTPETKSVWATVMHYLLSIFRRVSHQTPPDPKLKSWQSMDFLHNF